MLVLKECFQLWLTKGIFLKEHHNYSLQDLYLDFSRVLWNTALPNVLVLPLHTFPGCCGMQSFQHHWLSHKEAEAQDLLLSHHRQVGGFYVLSHLLGSCALCSFIPQCHPSPSRSERCSSNSLLMKL